MLKQITFRILILSSLSFLLNSAVSAQTPARLIDLKEKLPLNPAVRKGKLPNGFTYYLQRNVIPEKKAVFLLANRVGSMQEEESQRGLAHFLEHMAFNGTVHYPKNELINYLEKSGVKFGADLNAYTSFDETVYQLPIPTNDPLLVKNALQIMRDWSQGFLLDSSEIDRERGIILEEKRLKKSGQERVRLKTFPMLVNQSRYADREAIGLDEVILNFKHREIHNFYNDWYRPDLQALIIVGDIDVSAMETMIKEQFSDLKMPQIVKPRLDYKIGLKGESQFLAVADKELLSTVFQIVFKKNYLGTGDAAEYREAMIRFFANQLMGQRLTELSRQGTASYASCSASVGGLIKSLDGLSIQIVCKPGPLEASFKAGWGEILHIKDKGFSEAELQPVKKLLLALHDRKIKEGNKTTSDDLANSYLQNFLNDGSVLSVEAETRLINGLINEITPAVVNEFIRGYFTCKDRDIIIMSTIKDMATLPAAEDVDKWMSGANPSMLSDRKEIDINAPLLKRSPKPGRILSEVKNNKLQTTELILSNGAKVILKHTDFKNDELNLLALSKGGTSLYPIQELQSAINSVSIGLSGGVGNFTSNQLSRILNGKSVSVKPFIGDRAEGMQALASKTEMETMFQLIYLYFTQPKGDSIFFADQIKIHRDNVAQRYVSPENIFKDTISTIITQHDPRQMPPSTTLVDQINFKRGFEIYKERFGNAGDFVFTIVGNFDDAQIRSYLKTYIASLPSDPKREEAKNHMVKAPAGIINKTVRAGLEDKATVTIVIAGDYNFNETNNLGMDALASILNMKLLEELREKESGVYSPSASITYQKYPSDKYAVVISFGCAPGNVDKLSKVALGELKKLTQDKVDEAYLQKFIAEQEVVTQGAVKNNDFWINYLAYNRLDNMSNDMILNYDNELKKLSTTTLFEQAKKYLSEKNLMTFFLLPEKQ